MTDLERQLVDLFEARASLAVPVGAYEDVVHGIARVPVVSHRDHALRHRWRWLAVAAALLLAMAGTWRVVARHAERPPGAAAVVTFPAARPDAPRLDEASAARAERTIMVVRSTASGPRVADDSTWDGWSPRTSTVTDVDSATPAASYVATCCVPVATIWRNGVADITGSRIDYILDGVVRAIVDPDAGLATIGERRVTEPGAFDVALVDRTTALLLVDGPAPALVKVTAPEFGPDASIARTVLLLPEGLVPCGVVALESEAIVTFDVAVAGGRCSADRAVVVDPDALRVVGSMLLPAELTMVNSDHHRSLVAVSASGALLAAQTSDAPDFLTWSTVRDDGDVLAAAP